MASGNLSPSEVKGICDKLECSPSQHDSSGVHGGAPNLEPTAKHSYSATPGTHLKTSTSEFQMKDRSNSLPNFKGQFAKRAQSV